MVKKTSQTLVSWLFKTTLNWFRKSQKFTAVNSGDINPRAGKPFEPTADDFASKGAIMLDKKAKCDYLVDLPEGEDIADATNNAMRLIEEAYPDLQGVLPKNY